jgi:thioredoxin-dependent peroxiredoxin
MLVPGDKVPDIKVNDQDGNPVSLKDFRGQKVVLYFYPKDQTPGCTAEACNLRDNYKALQKKGFEIIGVSTDSEKSHQRFISKEDLPFTLLADTEKKLHEAFGTWVEKSMYGRRYMGTARVTFIIDEKGVIEDVIEKVDTKDHARQIMKGEITGPARAPKKAGKDTVVSKKASSKK